MRWAIGPRKLCPPARNMSAKAFLNISGDATVNFATGALQKIDEPYSGCFIAHIRDIQAGRCRNIEIMPISCSPYEQ